MQAIDDQSDVTGNHAAPHAQPAAAGIEVPHTLEAYAALWATRVALPVGILTGLVVFLSNLSRNPVPFIDDPRGFGTIFFLVSLGVGLIGGGWAYIVGTRFQNERLAPDYQRSWVLGFIPIALTYLVVTALGVGVLLEITSDAFKELALSRLQGVFLAGLAAGAVTNWILSSAMQIKLRQFLMLIALILGVGLYMSMSNNENPLWWQVSFSYLGTADSNIDARQQFNYTLIFGGLLILVLQQFLMKNIRILYNHQAISVRSFQFFHVSLILLGILVMLVGLFPSRMSPLSSIIHNLSAYSLAAILIFYMVAIRWLIPHFTRDFYIASFIGTTAMVGTLILAAFGYFNTVGLEIIAFVLAGMWLNLFVKNLEMLAKNLEPAAYVA